MPCKKLIKVAKKIIMHTASACFYLVLVTYIGPPDSVMSSKQSFTQIQVNLIVIYVWHRAYLQSTWYDKKITTLKFLFS